jgi:hypothetical protein
MSTKEIEDFLMKENPQGYSPEGLIHFLTMCPIIFEKFMDPKKPESSFVEAIYKGDWVKARAVGDLFNKEAIDANLYQNFVKFVKTSSEYITKMRDDKLNILFHE